MGRVACARNLDAAYRRRLRLLTATNRSAIDAANGYDRGSFIDRPMESRVQIAEREPRGEGGRTMTAQQLRRIVASEIRKALDERLPAASVNVAKSAVSEETTRWPNKDVSMQSDPTRGQVAANGASTSLEQMVLGWQRILRAKPKPSPRATPSTRKRDRGPSGKP